MARFAIKDGDRIANIVEASEDFAASQGWIPADGLAIGMVWDGAKFAPPPPPKEPVPISCTRRQGRLALLQVELLDDVENIISSIADPIERRKAQVEYEADTWERSNPFLINMWINLGGTEETLDDFFRLAITL